MQYLVFGGSGQLGQHIVHQLREIQADVINFDVREPELHKDCWVKGDITNMDDVLQATKGADVVFHTVAWINFNPKNRKRIMDINVLGTKHVIRACRMQGVSQLIFTSSIDVVFDGTPIVNGDENLPYPQNFLDDYGESKMLAEKAVLDANSPALLTLSLRVAGIYGPGDQTRFPALLKALKENKYMRLGDGSSKFNHLYVENAAYAHLLASEKLTKNPEFSGQVYFITDHPAENFNSFIERILLLAGFEVPEKRMSRSILRIIAWLSELWIRMPWIPATRNPLLTRYSVASTTVDFYFTGEKFRKDFGYIPPISLEEAISRTAGVM